jgi:hypothetical protein
MAMQDHCQVDIAQLHFEYQHVFAEVCGGKYDEKSNEIYRRCSLLNAFGLAFFEWRFVEAEQSRLRLRLFADEVLRLHDRSQDGRAMCLRNARRAASEGGSSR